MKTFKRFLLITGLALALLSPFAPRTLHLGAQERIGLTSPAFVDVGVTNVKMVFLQCDWDNQNTIIGLRATDTNAVPIPNRSRVDYTYTGVAASNLMRTLNTGNFSVNSLQKKALQKLQTDGFIGAGTFIGSPE